MRSPPCVSKTRKPNAPVSEPAEPVTADLHDHRGLPHGASWWDRVLFACGVVRVHRYTARLAHLHGTEIRLGVANRTVKAQMDRIEQLTDQVDELRADAFDAAHRAEKAEADLAAHLAGERADAATVTFTEARAHLLRMRGESQRDLLEAVGALLADEALALSSSACAPGVPEAEQRHLAGGAYHLTAARQRLARAARPVKSEA